jgi:hypothetical protein
MRLSMYDGWQSVINGVKNPRRAYHIVGKDVNRWWHCTKDKQYNPSGTSIHKKDWDNIVIIDSCRYDYFCKKNTLSGNLTPFQSLGSSSSEFVRANLGNTQHHDLVVTSANGWYEKVYLEEGFSIHDLNEVKPEHELNKNDKVYQKFAEEGRGGWVRPEPITEEAKRMVKKYPHKRHIIHYHQPHIPFIGPTGLEHFEELPLGWGDGGHQGNLSVPDSLIREAYAENVEIALNAVSDLLPHLDGKTVISADHGDLLGERGFPVPIKLYAHPSGYYSDILTKVPWFVVDYDDRRRIVKEEPEEKITVGNEQSIDKRLRNLGYKV